jgi:hypothetical protein
MNDSKAHVPIVALDEPYPPQLPVVRACGRCNASFSLDEQYLACFLECVLAGTAEPSGVRRSKVRRMLNENSGLKARIAAAQSRNEAGELTWRPQVDRVRRIIAKLAQGHVAYELYPNLEQPVTVSFVPFPLLSEQERLRFEDTPLGGVSIFPEIGTRAFRRTVVVTDENGPPESATANWIIVQPGRYRYSVEPDGLVVRMVLSEYLACVVAWGETEM